MFKWPDSPSPRAPAHEIADFVELVCWKQGGTSINDVRAVLGRLDENDYSGGVPEEDDVDGVVEDAYREIERRKEACRRGYPFETDSTGNRLSMLEDRDSRRFVVYRYLLLATRLDMRSDRRNACIDGTSLLEELAAESAREYFGDRAESLVFGSGGGYGFRHRVGELCNRLREGGGYRNDSDQRPTAKDGKLDVVVWKHFADRCPGKLIAFGQCKTGTHYRDAVTQLQPDSFCRKWLRKSPAFVPVRMFFVAEALSRSDRWYETVSDAGLLFDRCRIVDYCERVREDVLEKVSAWTVAGAEANELPG